MEWWEKMLSPLQRLWSDVASHLRFRKTGLLMLHREVKACEYEDVQIMWEMLKKSETELARYPASRGKNRRYWNIFGWARFTPCLGSPLKQP